MTDVDVYTWDDGRLFVNGEYRAVLESKTLDDGICQHVTALCNQAEQDAPTVEHRAQVGIAAEQESLDVG